LNPEPWAVTEVIQNIHATPSLLVPEIILLGAACALFLLGPMLESRPGMRHEWGILSVAAMGVALSTWLGGGLQTGPGALFYIDEFAWYTRGLALSGGIALALMLWNQIDDSRAAEAHACLLSIIAGTNLVAAADDLVSLFLALELVSIPTYVLLYLPSRGQGGRESAIKYFLLSVFSSVLVLYGMSWLYGAAGSTNFGAIATAVAAGETGFKSNLPQVALAFFVAGLCFRIAAVPFHFYAPDVFQGTTASNAALLSFIPKVVGFIALIRLVPLTEASATFMPWAAGERARLLFAVLAVATMFVGNLMALRQANLYRLMAYSSIAHAGYMLIGLGVGDAGIVGGIDAIMFYLAAYGLMTVGAFALLSALAIDRRTLETDRDLRGLSRQHPTIGLLLAVCLFSLTGLPPTAGFLGKLNLFLAAWSDRADKLGPFLAIMMAFNAGIAAWYYLRLIALMFLDPAGEFEPRAHRVVWSSFVAGVVCSVGTIALFVAPQWLWDNLP
jgi:NADH-quinone oxidoreductase subunit N